MADKLVEAVPELRPAYQKELEWWGDQDAGAHNIYSEVLKPYLISLLNSDGHAEALRRVFGFLEQLANHEDRRVQEVVAFSVLEELGGESELVEKARKHMGPKTLEFSHEVEKFWGRE
jgi:hypothetical protein